MLTAPLTPSFYLVGSLSALEAGLSLFIAWILFVEVSDTNITTILVIVIGVIFTALS